MSPHLSSDSDSDELDRLRRRIASLEQQIARDATESSIGEFGATDVLEAIVAASPLPIVALTREGSITLWNPAAERVFGWSAAEVLGRPLPFIPEDKYEEHRAMRQADLSGQGFTNKEIRRRCKDGTLIDLNVSTAPLRDRAGQIVGIMSIYVDVTERRLMERALRDSEQRLDLAVRAHHIGIFDWDIPSGNLLWTEEEERLFGLEPGTFEGEIAGWASRVLPEDRAQVERQFAECWSNRQEEMALEFRIVWLDGAIRNIEGSGRFVYAADGTPLRMVGVNIDTTERRATERDLQAREQELRTLLAALPDVITRFDPASRITYVSPAAERLTGFGPSFFIGKTPLQAGVPATIAAALTDSLNRVLATGGTDAVEFNYHSPHLGLRHLVGTGVPEWGPGGEVVSVLYIVRDITQQKQNEAALRASEERLRLAADAGGVGLWDWDINANRVSWSDRIYDFHGVAPGSFNGTVEGFMRLVHPEDQPLLARSLEQALSGQAEFAPEFRTVRPDGSVRWIAARAQVVFDHSGRPIRMLGASTDVTESREAGEALQRANRELEEFAYAATHDLREPLRTINNYTQLMLRSVAGEPDIKKWGDFIQEAVRRMEMLIDDLLTFSRVTQVEVELQAVDMNSILDEVLRILAVDLREAGATVTRMPLPALRADPVQMGQLLQNLLSNAVKYRRPGVALCLGISAVQRDVDWVFSIEDNGVGFRPEYAERIFGLFKRLHGREIPGTGVGLGICRRIIERHGGMIWAESAGEHQGAAFRFTLPRSDLTRQ